MLKDIVTIIICTFNQEDTVGKTIEAIVKQESRLPFEVIIGDDCSTDGTAKVCQQYVEKYPVAKDGEPDPKVSVRLFSWKENRGVLDNYYSCVREARGKYIMECGGDDVWCEGRINLCLDIMEKHPNVVQVLTDLYQYYSNTGVKATCTATYTNEGVVSGHENSLAFLNARGALPGYYAMTRTEKMLQLMEKYPRFFYGRAYRVEDLQLAVLIGSLGDVYFTPAQTYYYTTDGDSIYQTPNDRKRYAVVKNCTQLRHDLSEALGISHDEMRSAYTYYIYVMLMHAFRIHAKDLRDDAFAFAKNLNAGGWWKYSMTHFIMSNEVTWNLALGLRRLYLKMKTTLPVF